MMIGRKQGRQADSMPMPISMDVNLMATVFPPYTRKLAKPVGVSAVGEFYSQLASELLGDAIKKIRAKLVTHTLDDGSVLALLSVAVQDVTYRPPNKNVDITILRWDLEMFIWYKIGIGKISGIRSVTKLMIPDARITR